MDPTHKALLSELLQRATAMPVHEVTDGQREPGSVYVIPRPGHREGSTAQADHAVVRFVGALGRHRHPEREAAAATC